MRFWQLVRLEFKAIFSDKAILLTVFGGILFYSLLYPSPYLNQVPTKQQIVVVDHDNSSLSRAIIRNANANPKIDIVAKVHSIEEAKHWITSAQAYGLLVIPANFRQNILLGKTATLSYGGDASYFLIYSAIAQGLIEIGLNAGKEVQHLALLSRGHNPNEVEKSINSINLNSLPAFNPSLGYIPYIVPGLFLLILHQTLLIACGILGAGQWQQPGYWSKVSPTLLICARAMTFFILYSLFGSFYIGYCYYLYEVSLLAQLSQVLLLMLPFLLATTMLGITLSTLFKSRDMPTQAFLLVSMPILFVSGFVWPIDLIPAPIIFVAQIVPAVPAIKAMLMLNQMGAPWHSIIIPWLQLWGLFVVFFVLAIFAIQRRQKQFLK